MVPENLTADFEVLDDESKKVRITEIGNKYSVSEAMTGFIEKDNGIVASERKHVTVEHDDGGTLCWLTIYWDDNGHLCVDRFNHDTWKLEGTVSGWRAWLIWWAYDFRPLLDENP